LTHTVLFKDILLAFYSIMADQHLTSRFFANFLFSKKITKYKLYVQKNYAQHLNAKAALKKFMILTPAINFTNISRAAFMTMSLHQKLP